MWRLLFLFILSCAHLQTPKTLDSALSALKFEGEGKGRLGINQQSYVFGMEAVLKENKDWILAVNMPLHGEEVMTISNLKNKTVEAEAADSFERRIELTLQQELKGALSGKVFLQELRLFLRFVMKDKLELKRECREVSSGTFKCVMDEDELTVYLQEKKLRIVHDLVNKTIELTAENLTEKRYLRSNFMISNPSTKQSDITLELFWN